MVSCPANPSRFRKSVDWHSRSIPDANRSASAAGTSKPLTPFSMTSAMPHVFVVTAGIPVAIASSKVSGIPSTNEGKTKIS
jgi:hypothetical protein